jgi:LPS-assembly lipoprotein
MKRVFAIGLLGLAILTLPACSLQPLYAGGASGAAGQMLGAVEVSAIPGKAGWLVRDALYAKLGAVKEGTPRYRLDVELDDQITGFGVRRDDAITRERRTLRARYKLVDTASNAVLLDTTAGSDIGIDAVSSEYATVAAENSALERLAQILADQIVTRIAVQAQSSNRAP